MPEVRLETEAVAQGVADTAMESGLVGRAAQPISAATATIKLKRKPPRGGSALTSLALSAIVS